MSGATAEFDGASATRETTDALLVTFDGRTLWVPKSIIHADSEVYREGDEGKLVVLEWWAVKRELV